MKRNFLTGITITAMLTVIFLVIFYYSKINTKSIHAINVLPKNTVLAVEVNSINHQFKLLNQQLFWQQLTNNKSIGEANNNLKYLDSLLDFESNLKEWKNNENMVVSFHAFANKSIDELVLIETIKKFEIKDICNWIYENNKNRLMFTKRKFENNIIYDFIDFKTLKKFSIAVKNKIFAISSNGQLIEETLANIENENVYKISNLDKLSFVKSLGTYNLYVNYKNLPLFLNSFIDLSKTKALQNFSNMASWSAFGVNTSDNSIQLKGVSITDEVQFQYFDCFNNMTAQEQSFKKILPINTSYFFGINFNDEKIFSQNLKEYYTVNKIDSRNLIRDSINTAKSNVNLYKQITENFGNEIAQLNLSNPQLSFDSCEVLVIKLKDKNNLINLLKSISINDSIGVDTLMKKTPDLYKINLQNYFDYTWGNIFMGIQANYALVYSDYLLVCNNSITLNGFYNQQVNEFLLSKNIDFTNHESELKGSSNMELFINNNNLAVQGEYLINTELLESYKSNIGYVKKTRFISMQMSATNNKNYLTNVQISFNVNANKNTELLWELSLDTTLNIKPQIVFNSSTNQNAIMVQDLKNQVYLINNESKILFKIPVYGQIIGNIHQVDAYNNGKTQYLFNTNSQIYLIDETGKNLQGYPIWIPTGTVFPIQVLDYLNDKSYQIFAIGKFYKIWCYNIQGRLQNGWNPKNYYPNPIQNIQAFNFRNELITYTINQKGKLNFYQTNGKLYSNFSFDSNMVYKYMAHEILDSNFIKFYYIDSTNQFKVKEFHTLLPIKNMKINSIKSVPVQSFNLNNFIYFLTKNGTSISIYNNVGIALFSKNLADTFNYQFDLIYKNGNINLCYLDSLQGKLYLENKENKPIDKFPLKANYYYTFGHLMNDENYFVITANFDNKLFVYQVK
ncbi:MAG: hypothetical protein K9G64_03355 [Bacteroidia bacterium]|nr:hypothetical protein [Bacteroidia bacterium]